jgi:hypothetical protein
VIADHPALHQNLSPNLLACARTSSQAHSLARPSSRPRIASTSRPSRATSPSKLLTPPALDDVQLPQLSNPNSELLDAHRRSATASGVAQA